MSMSKRDFEAIAKTISGEGDRFTSQQAHAQFAASMASTLSDLAPAFKRGQFIAACQPSWTIGTTKSTPWDVRIASANAALAPHADADFRNVGTTITPASK